MNKWIEFKIVRKGIVEEFKEFLETIPFRTTYGHLSYSYGSEENELSIFVGTKRSVCYKLISKWVKDKQKQNIVKGDSA